MLVLHDVSDYDRVKVADAAARDVRRVRCGDTPLGTGNALND